MFKYLMQIIGVFLLILLVSGLPIMFGIDDERDVVFRPEVLVIQSADLLTDLSQGTLGTYWIGRTERSIADDLVSFTEQSFILLLSSLLIAVISSIVFGLFLHHNRLSRGVKRVLDFLSTIPDFIMIMFFLVGAIAFYQMTDIRLITLSPFAEGGLRLWFPIVVLSIGPTIFLLKMVDLKYYQVGGEDYIRTALAKGLAIRHIQLHHVYKNIKPFLVADLKKAIAITIANLFVVEYLLNVSGITRFIFGDYAFATAAIGLGVLLLLSVLIYGLIRGILYLFERGFIYE
ncbi:ABC transporter permease subunit [Brevibacillus dissolubilis]|uniref:ABC transporter permease subunit n=1 Tax=Brevibacillus dissolubilis TaxID=1844116 RepID=UPI0021001100|nr:ABC transporter permease subunit [Brevibacillus dissolubilis]